MEGNAPEVITEQSIDEKIEKFHSDFERDIKTLAKHYGATIVVAAQFASPRGITINHGSADEQTNEMILLGLATKLHSYVTSEI